MNELSTEKTMTVKEVAETMGVSRGLIEKRIRELFPDKMQQGKTTYLNEAEVAIISIRIKENPILIPRDLEQKTEIERLKPKAELADKAIRDESKQFSIRDSGKHLGLSQSERFTLMREKGLLTIKNLPTQKALNYNVLSIKTNVVNGKNREQSVMTMDNINEFNKRYLYKGGK